MKLFRGKSKTFDTSAVDLRPTLCHLPGKNVTFPDLMRQATENPKDFIRHRIQGQTVPHEFTFIFFWSMMAYFPEFLDAGMFDKLEKASVHLRTDPKYETPFTYVLREKRALVIGFRGTWTAADIHRTLLRMYRKGRVPTPLRNYETEILELYNNSPHRGIVYHALKSLALVLDILEEADRERTIFLHGHSLGAATAVIAAHFLVRMGYTKVHVGVLSCPRIFHRDSQFLAANLIPSYMHFYDANDAVSTKMVNAQSLFYGLAEVNVSLRSPYLDGTAPGFKAIHTHSIFSVPAPYTTLYPDHVFMSWWRTDLKLCSRKGHVRKLHVPSYAPVSRSASSSRSSGTYKTSRSVAKGSLAKKSRNKTPVRTLRASPETRSHTQRPSRSMRRTSSRATFK